MPPNLLATDACAPRLPGGYRLPPEAAHLRAALLAADRNAPFSDRLVLTDGPADGMGLPGGTGKSLLMAAVAADPDIVAAFPGGLVWIPVRVTDDLATLVHRAAATVAPAARVARNARAGEENLRFPPRSLVVLDGVRDASLLEPFRVYGGAQLVIITRRFAVAGALYAKAVVVAASSEAQALAQLAAAVWLPASALPRAAAALLRSCAGQPLVLALAAGALRFAPERRWTDLAGLLARAGNVCEVLAAAFDFALTSLPPRLADRYLDLAVFERTGPVRDDVLARLWSADDAAALVVELAGRALVTPDRAGRIGVPPALADLVAGRAIDLPARHGRVLAVLRHDLGGELTGAGDDREVGDQVVEHLFRAEGARATRDLVLDRRFMRRRVRAAGPHALVHDLERLDLGRDEEARRVRDALLAAAERLEVDPALLDAALATARATPMMAAHLALENLHPLDPPNGAVILGSGAPAWARARQRVRTFEGHTEPVAAVAITPQGAVAATASDDGTVKVWSTTDGRLLATLPLDDCWPCGVAVLDGGARCLTASLTGLAMWDVRSGRRLSTFPGSPGLAGGLSVSPVGVAITGGGPGEAALWELATGRLLHRLGGHGDEVNVVSISADGTRALSSARNHVVQLWDVVTGKLLRRWPPRALCVNAAALSGDGRWALLGCGEHLRLLDIASGHWLRSWHLPVCCDEIVRAVAITPDGRWAVSASEETVVRLWDLVTGTQVHAESCNEERVDAVAITDDGRLFLSNAGDYTVTLWRAPVESGERPRLEPAVVNQQN